MKSGVGIQAAQLDTTFEGSACRAEITHFEERCAHVFERLDMIGIDLERTLEEASGGVSMLEMLGCTPAQKGDLELKVIVQDFGMRQLECRLGFAFGLLGVFQATRDASQGGMRGKGRGVERDGAREQAVSAVDVGVFDAGRR